MKKKVISYQLSAKSKEQGAKSKEQGTIQNSKFKIKHYFNMVEIALAMGIIAIGLTGVFGVFPLALNTTRNAVGTHFSSNMGEKFVQYIAQEASDQTATDSDWINNHNTIAVNGNLDLYFPLGYNQSVADLNTDSFLKGGTLSNGADDEIEMGGWCLATTTEKLYDASNGGVVYAGTDSPGHYFLLSSDNYFHGEGIVWKSPIYTGATNADSIPMNIAMGINIEITWPFEMEYSKRKAWGNVKRYYLEVFNNN